MISQDYLKINLDEAEGAVPGPYSQNPRKVVTTTLGLRIVVGYLWQLFSILPYFSTFYHLNKSTFFWKTFTGSQEKVQ